MCIVQACPYYKIKNAWTAFFFLFISVASVMSEIFMYSYFYVNHKIIFEYCAAYSALNKARPFCVSEQGKGTTKCAYRKKNVTMVYFALISFWF